MFHTFRFAVVAAASALLTLVPIQAMASDPSMRCGTHLIYAGGGKGSSRMYEILKKCGEPEAKNGNNWVYTQGNMIRILTFNFEGRLRLIESERK